MYLHLDTILLSVHNEYPRGTKKEESVRSFLSNMLLLVKKITFQECYNLSKIIYLFMLLRSEPTNYQLLFIAK